MNKARFLYNAFKSSLQTDIGAIWIKQASEHAPSSALLGESEYEGYKERSADLNPLKSA